MCTKSFAVSTHDTLFTYIARFDTVVLPVAHKVRGAFLYCRLALCSGALLHVHVSRARANLHENTFEHTSAPTNMKHACAK